MNPLTWKLSCKIVCLSTIAFFLVIMFFSNSLTLFLYKFDLMKFFFFLSQGRRNNLRDLFHRRLCVLSRLCFKSLYFENEDVLFLSPKAVSMQPGNIVDRSYQSHLHIAV